MATIFQPLGPIRLNQDIEDLVTLVENVSNVGGNESEVGWKILWKLNAVPKVVITFWQQRKFYAFVF